MDYHRNSKSLTKKCGSRLNSYHPMSPCEAFNRNSQQEQFPFRFRRLGTEVQQEVYYSNLNLPLSSEAAI